MSNNAVARNVTFYPEDLAALHQIGKDLGLSGRSATIRYLIAYFKRTAGGNGNLAEQCATYNANVTQPAR